MPKERRINSSSFDRSTVSPYSRTSKISDPTKPETLSSHAGNEIEWEQARCPICIEHPHNAVLLHCSSRENGCRPFICDTSYRHSNCFDQFRKSSSQSQLVCPLCRGSITGWDVVGPARRFMNDKSRNCSLDTCEFNGNYCELRKHARAEHPFERPSAASPARLSDWTVLEQRVNMEDALAHQSDIELDWDGLLSWDGLAENDEFLSDGSFFDFPSGLSDIGDDLVDDDMFSGLPLHSSFHEDELMDSGSSIYNQVENNLSDFWSRSSYRSVNEEMVVSSPRSNHQGQNVYTRTRVSYHEENGSNSRSRSSYHHENGLVSSRTRTRSSYQGDSTRTSSRAQSRFSRLFDEFFS
ncbi:hypothetical protein CASFOL_038666 [Castilleja foliolosa]|uniref:Uncharacterized protein n=1 Tax=Castilleja foliolosa TaxID=1961234 RepID=A0ABD3BLL8_9LAMI